MAIPPHRRRAQQRRRVVALRHSFKIVAIAPFVAFLLVFAGYPLIRIVQMAFSNVDTKGGGLSLTFVGMDNFVKGFINQQFRESLFVSVQFIVLSTVISVLFGLALAIFTDRATLLQGLARNVLVWPSIIAPVVVSVLWVLVLNSQVGVLNKILLSLSLPEQGWLGSGTGAMLSIVAVDVWHWTPVVFLLLYTALKAIDASLLEAAHVDGASDWQMTRYILLPLLTPALIAAVAVRIVMGVKVFDEMYLLTHGGPGTSTQVVSLFIRGVVFDNVDLGFGSALSLMVVVLVLLVVIVILTTRRLVSGGQK